jgi:hypothetical protein
MRSSIELGGPTYVLMVPSLLNTVKLSGAGATILPQDGYTSLPWSKLHARPSTSYLSKQALDTLKSSLNKESGFSFVSYQPHLTYHRFRQQPFKFQDVCAN